MATKRVLVRLEPPLMIDHPVATMGTSLLDSERHGPFRFSPLGVAFGPLDGPAGFVPWVQTAGVVGWEPPEPKAQQPVDGEQGRGKFRPQ
jgi:hypothetical protein